MLSCRPLFTSLHFNNFVLDWGDRLDGDRIFFFKVEEVDVCLPLSSRAIPGKVAHLSTFEACPLWCGGAVGRSIVLWAFSFFCHGGASRIPLLSLAPLPCCP